jgi:hypothetical protein
MKGKIIAFSLISLLSTTVLANNLVRAQLLSHHEWTTGHARLINNINHKHPVNKFASHSSAKLHPAGLENIVSRITLFVDSEGTTGIPNDIGGYPTISIFNDDDKSHTYKVSSQVCTLTLDDYELGCTHSESKFWIDAAGEIADYIQGLHMNYTYEKAGVYQVKAHVTVIREDTDQRFTTLSDNSGIVINDPASKIK